MKNSSSMKVTLGILIMSGVWYPNFKSKLMKYLFYLYALLYQVVVAAPIIIIEILHLYEKGADLEAIMIIVLLFLSHVSMIPKLYIIWHRQDKLKSLLELIDSPTFTRKDPVKKAIIEKTTYFAYLVSIIFESIVSFTGVMWALFPMLQSTLQLPLGYPQIDGKSYMFIPLYIFQIICMTLVGLSAASADLLISGFMAVAAAELDLLYYELIAIGNDKEKNDCDEHQLRDCYWEAISCVKFHLDIISLVKEIESSFSLPLLFQFFASSIMLCGTIFRISISKEPLEITTMIFYILCVTTELLVLCYFGEIVKYKSEKLAIAAYSGDWSTMSGRTKKALAMLTVRAQRPLILTAGNLVNYTLAAATAVVRTSYSYFAVLRQRHVRDIK